MFAFNLCFDYIAMCFLKKSIHRLISGNKGLLMFKRFFFYSGGGSQIGKDANVKVTKSLIKAYAESE